MGEIAEMMLDGTLCQVCGEFIGDDCGYPVTCEGCAEDDEESAPVKKKPKHDTPFLVIKTKGEMGKLREFVKTISYNHIYWGKDAYDNPLFRVSVVDSQGRLTRVLTVCCRQHSFKREIHDILREHNGMDAS